MSVTNIWPDTEHAVRTWLRQLNTSAEGRCYFGLPDHEPKGPWVTLYRAGGGPTVENVPFDNVRLRFDCWARTKYESYQLAAEVSSALFALTAGDQVGPCVACAVELHSMMWLPDPLENTPRYIVDASIILRSEGA